MSHDLFLVRCSNGLYARKSIRTPHGKQLVTWVADAHRASLFFADEIRRVRARAKTHGFSCTREKAAA